ncbi:MAG: L,D-transpeptidase family protein [Elusimicrobia bacterium]|nr:L,D-transpeptidase family protein [Elusimicrobiota bacterium]
MRLKLIAIAALPGLLFACAPKPVIVETPCVECRTLRHRIELGMKRKVRGETLAMPKTDSRFYHAEEDRLVWSTDGCLLPRATALMDALRASDEEGLTPGEYHLHALDQILKRWPDPLKGSASPELATDADILFTDAYLLYASQLLGGRTNPEMARAQWSIVRKKADLVDTMSSAIATNDIAGSLRRMAPGHAGYTRLRSLLGDYRRIAHDGGWPQIPSGPALRRGMSDARVPTLRRRLAIEAFDVPPEEKSKKFDGRLERRLKEFQSSHGLDADGHVGPETLAQLNVPVEDRINQIKFSMDRWRWLPLDLGRRFIIVNIPEYRLFAFENGRPSLAMPIIVGKNNDETATPVFSNQMTYLEFSPEWLVPARIAKEEMLPAIRRDPNYIKRNHLEVLVATSPTAAWSPVNPADVDWASVSTTTPGGFPYFFRQSPGPWNALGPIKFMFPNEYSVYIHGNPEEGLFDRRLRMFSHGCVRVDRPITLAKWVLNDPDWTLDRLKQYMNQPKPVQVPLGEPVPVYIVYFTAWVDDEGKANFRDDIYGRDLEMRQRFYAEPAPPKDAAKEPAPTPAPSKKRSPKKSG